jgi:hypothetical protein
MESFNAANEQQLLVSGLKDTVALTLGSRGEVVSRVVVELMLDALGTASTHILRTGWLPHSTSACFVLTTQFLKGRRRVEHHEGVGSTALVPGGAEERTLQLLRQMSAAGEAASTERRAHLCAGVSSLDNP